jgi:hypothetical protein
MLEQQDSVEPTATPEQAEAIATLAYGYGFPLVLMDVSREVMTAVPSVEAQKAPINQFVHIAEFPDDTYRDVVSPNVDTLYSLAWLDLAAEPIVLRVPDLGDRYYLMQICDAWTDVFAAPGTRTTGNSAGAFALVGPDWHGTLPSDVKKIAAPTNLAWIIGRTYTAGRAEYGVVHAIQRQYELIPLSAWGRAFKPPAKVPVAPGVDNRTPPVVQVGKKMDAGVFLARLAQLMGSNPPAPEDEPMISRLRLIGVAPGAPFAFDRLPPRLKTSIESGIAAGRARLAEAAKAVSEEVPAHGWRIERNLGRYGTDYATRALVAVLGLGSNLPEDAVYPITRSDADGARLTGANRYRLHFEAGELPPVDAFWSVTMYTIQQSLVKNPIGRYALDDRQPLRFNADGSLDLYLQNADPGPDKHANWLPAPPDGFSLVMRLYSPKKAVIDGTWTPPPVVRD